MLESSGSQALWLAREANIITTSDNAMMLRRAAGAGIHHSFQGGLNLRLILDAVATFVSRRR